MRSFIMHKKQRTCKKEMKRPIWTWLSPSTTLVSDTANHKEKKLEIVKVYMDEWDSNALVLLS